MAVVLPAVALAVVLPARPDLGRELSLKWETARYLVLNRWYALQAHPLLLPTPVPVPEAEDEPAEAQRAEPAGAAAGPFRGKAAAEAAEQATPRDARTRAEPSRNPATSSAVPVAPRPGEDTVSGALSPTPTPRPTAPPVSPIQPAVRLRGFSHEYQRWNNCGPVTIAMALSHYGQSLTQYETAPILKGNRDDKNISPKELAAFARDQGFGAVVRYGGTVDLLQLLLSNGFPVIVESWFAAGRPDNEVGHYRLLIGYDRAAGHFVSQDSYNGPDYRISFAEQDRLWRYFNRTYLVVYDPRDEGLVRAVLGTHWDPARALTDAAGQAREEVEARPADAIGWFNLGTSLTGLGRYQEAAVAYDRARSLGLHFRTLWYQFGPYEAYFHIERYADVLTLAEASLRTARTHEESHYWMGRALQAQARVEEARQAYRLALQDNPRHQPAQEALIGLESESG